MHGHCSGAMHLSSWYAVPLGQWQPAVHLSGIEGALAQRLEQVNGTTGPHATYSLFSSHCIAFKKTEVCHYFIPFIIFGIIGHFHSNEHWETKGFSVRKVIFLFLAQY